jgi:two-component system, cell cycle sensor histidine kinase and response regulator CckA
MRRRRRKFGWYREGAALRESCLARGQIRGTVLTRLSFYSGSEGSKGMSMQENDERLLQAIRVGNIGIFEHDHAADLIYWSLELRRMYGWDASEPATLAKIIGHVHPDDKGRVIAAVRSAHDPNGSGAFDIEHRIIARHGAVRWVLTRSHTQFEEVAGQRRPGRTIGAVQDVTERRNAEDRLRVLDTVLSSSAQAIAIADSQGKLTFANDALRRLWGYADADVLLGRSLFDFWKSDDEPSATMELVKAKRSRSVELLASRVDGTPFYLSLKVEAVCDAQGELTQALVTFTEAQLGQAQKMESIGRMAGGIAHDFNNILTVIVGNLELGCATLPPQHSSRQHLDVVAEAAGSAASLTRQLLAFSRRETIAPRALDLNAVIRRVTSMLQRIIGRNIELRTIYGGDLPPVCFDPGQAEQIIMNLALNARDAMTNGGLLTLKTASIQLDEDQAKRHVDAVAGRFVVLAVSDTGAGMTEEVQAHLFEPFFTSKEAGQGTGLGLAVVYGAVRQNGGWIEFESELNRGSTFRVYLPTTPLRRAQQSESGASAG